MTKILLLILTLFIVVGCNEGSDTIEAELIDNAELLELFEQDQADRSDVENIDWAVVSRRDSLRRARVFEIRDSGQVVTTKDYYHAAMVFQHGSDTTASGYAYRFAKQSVEIDPTNERAKWLMAAAWDRHKMRLGEPQWYGTQFVKDGAESPWRLYDIDTTRVTDAERESLGVPPLEEARARVLKMNGISD